MTRKLATALAAVALTAALGGAALAQDADTAKPEAGDEQTVEVVFGGYGYSLLADEPVQACVIADTESLDGASVQYRLFVRELDGSFSSVGVYASPAIGAFDGAEANDCLNLEGLNNAG